jgi:hypothetical protein
MNEPLIVLMLIVVISACLVALFVLVQGLFPRHIAWTSRAAQESPGRAFMLGVANAVFLGAVSLALLSGGQPFVQFVGGVVGAALLIGVSFGLSGMVQLVGQRILPEASSLRRILASSVVVIAACLVPYLGWFVLFPYLALRGLGAWILGWYRQRKMAEAVSDSLA